MLGVSEGDIVSVIPCKGIDHLVKEMFDDDHDHHVDDVADWVMRGLKFRVVTICYQRDDPFHKRLSFELIPVDPNCYNRDQWWYPNYSIKLWREKEQDYDPGDD